MEKNTETSYRQANFDRYTNPAMIAAYLESEWSDFLFNVDPESETPNPDPMEHSVRPTFYKRIAELAHSAIEKTKISPKRYCDIGGATGRTIYEVSHQIGTLAELVLVEPTPIFREWARRFLKGTDHLKWVPRVDTLEKAKYVEAHVWPSPIDTTKNLDICNASAENVPRPAGYFDLITCLNVADRHNDPFRLIKDLHELLALNGLLIVASPLDFIPEFTPNKDYWIKDLNVLFPESEWLAIDEDNIVYDFHYYGRKWTRFNTQIVIKQKIK